MCPDRHEVLSCCFGHSSFLHPPSILCLSGVLSQYIPISFALGKADRISSDSSFTLPQNYSSLPSVQTRGGVLYFGGLVLVSADLWTDARLRTESDHILGSLASWLLSQDAVQCVRFSEVTGTIPPSLGVKSLLSRESLLLDYSRRCYRLYRQGLLPNKQLTDVI